MREPDTSPSERAETDAAAEANPRTLSGVDRLRALRGNEQVTFNEVADHLGDFVERHPHAHEEVDNLAAFLAAVERKPHRHDVGVTSSLGKRVSAD
jgi:hypothetical protein